MNEKLKEVITGAQSANDRVRESSERTLWSLCSEDPGATCTSLIQIACSFNMAIENRIFSLLSLRKLITMYWSAGFESYRGPPGIGGEGKRMIRESLLKLGFDDNQDARLKNCSSYCIVQIAAVDFPDEWPTLVDSIFDAILQRQSLSALYVLNEIFDDVVSEEMFFHHGIGWQTLQLISRILNSPESPIQAKTSSAKLYQTCLLQLQSPMATSTPEYKHLLSNHIRESVPLLVKILKEYRIAEGVELNTLDLQRALLSCLNTIKTGFPKKLFTMESAEDLKTFLLESFRTVAELCIGENATSDPDMREAANEVGIKIVSLFAVLMDTLTENQNWNIIVESFVLAGMVSDEDEECWENDFNVFATKETGLSTTFTIRDESEQFMQGLSGFAYNSVFDALVAALTYNESSNWKVQESILFFIQALCGNEDDEASQDIEKIHCLLRTLRELLELNGSHILVKTRCLIALPKVIERFMDSLENVKALVKEFLFASFSLGRQTSSHIIKIGCLISFTYYANFAELDSVLGPAAFEEAQRSVSAIIQDLLEEAEDDTPSVLLEALAPTLSSTHRSAETISFYQLALQLILKISSKDPSNIQVVLEAQDCLSNLLKNISTEDYVTYSKTCIPLFVNVLSGMIENKYSYAPIVCLTLEMLTVFMKRKPADGFLPHDIASYVFEPLSDILINSSDDEVMQLTSDALVYLISNSEPRQLLPYLNIVLCDLEKLLSVETSDSGAMNVGTLLVVVLEKFSKQLQEIYPRILEAATKKFLGAHNVATTENLVYVFCYLVSLNPAEVINFLSSFTNGPQGQSVLCSVLSKWLESFEVLRGERRIKENIMALSKLFFQADTRISEIYVNGDPIPYSGDVIVTRSMAKNMPERYTRITAYQKIVKLFVAELDFQTSQTDLEKYLPSSARKVEHSTSSNAEVDQEESDWEDVDDVLEYEQLQHFADQDTFSNSQGDEDLILGVDTVQQNTRDLLVSFFKEAASKNSNDFKTIYDNLTENERRILSDNLV
ncbi:LAQU0S14e02960g1_1 [Lachancea quebecensis]|uniref:LAQU0S14e02960g1_1 n=1 Tax=Lachancea quebecensis TaxID=1654605 RepID=A0A0P1KW52_9SACH|nr:LAQU0S14e02960g1_1 [Lachancea quebecensis]